MAKNLMHVNKFGNNITLQNYNYSSGWIIPLLRGTVHELMIIVRVFWPQKVFIGNIFINKYFGNFFRHWLLVVVLKVFCLVPPATHLFHLLQFVYYVVDTHSQSYRASCITWSSGPLDCLKYEVLDWKEKEDRFWNTGGIKTVIVIYLLINNVDFFAWLF